MHARAHGLSYACRVICWPRGGQRERQASMTAITRLLLTNGADPNVQNKDGYTALILAVKRNRMEDMDHLLANGADPNLQNKFGYSALAWAVKNGKVVIARALLANGADPNAKNEYGDTALIMAVPSVWLVMGTNMQNFGRQLLLL